MTQHLKRITDLIRPQRGRAPMPDPSFWAALIAIHSYYFEDELLDYQSSPKELRRRHIFKALRTIDCWIDVAIQSGWLSEDKLDT